MRQKDNDLKNIFISVQMYTLIRLISAGVSEIIRFECFNSLLILKFIPGNKCAVMQRRGDRGVGVSTPETFGRAVPFLARRKKVCTQAVPFSE